MRKICREEKCNNYVWGSGYCICHQPKKPLKRSPLPRIGKNKSNKDKLIDIVNESGKMVSFFMDIWYKKHHICENCGTYLGEEARSYMFDHLLEKSKYPELKYEEGNIMILCLECHDKKTRGFISETIQNRINQVKTKFNIT